MSCSHWEGLNSVARPGPVHCCSSTLSVPLLLQQAFWEWEHWLLHCRFTHAPCSSASCCSSGEVRDADCCMQWSLEWLGWLHLLLLKQGLPSPLSASAFSAGLPLRSFPSCACTYCCTGDSCCLRACTRCPSNIAAATAHHQASQSHSSSVSFTMPHRADSEEGPIRKLETVCGWCVLCSRGRAVATTGSDTAALVGKNIGCQWVHPCNCWQTLTSACCFSCCALL